MSRRTWEGARPRMSLQRLSRVTFTTRHILQASRSREMTISQMVTLSVKMKSIASHALMKGGVHFMPSVTLLVTALPGGVAVPPAEEGARFISIACKGSSAAVRKSHVICQSV